MAQAFELAEVANVSENPGMASEGTSGSLCTLLS